VIVAIVLNEVGDNVRADVAIARQIQSLHPVHVSARQIENRFHLQVL
jgi:hypothetical protein